jgi:hypothetical protein
MIQKVKTFLFFVRLHLPDNIVKIWLFWWNLVYLSRGIAMVAENKSPLF